MKHPAHRNCIILASFAGLGLRLCRRPAGAASLPLPAGQPAASCRRSTPAVPPTAR